MTEHLCYACDDQNPNRLVAPSDDGWEVEFIDRYVGPPGRAHGGITVGALTCPALQIAERDGMRNPVVRHVTGRINIPAPLSTPVRVVASFENGRYHIQLLDGSIVVIDGYVRVIDQKTEVGSVIQEIPSELVENVRGLSEIADAKVEGPSLFSQLAKKSKAAGLTLVDEKYRCFGCGEAENSLKLHHRVARRGDTWTPWESERSFTDGDNRLATAITVAAIDCANQYTPTADDPDFVSKQLTERKMWVTGQLGVHFVRVPPVEVEGGYRVAARFLGQEGRKLLSMSALLDKEGTVYAIGEAIAIIIDIPPAMFRA